MPFRFTPIRGWLLLIGEFPVCTNQVTASMADMFSLAHFRFEPISFEEGSAFQENSAPASLCLPQTNKGSCREAIIFSHE